MENGQYLVIPILIGILEVFKKAGIPVRFIPLLSILLGITFSIGLENLTMKALMSGMVYGLSACGLYSGTKTLIDIE